MAARTRDGASPMSMYEMQITFTPSPDSLERFPDCQSGYAPLPVALVYRGKVHMLCHADHSTPAAPGDCYCFSTLNPKIAFVPSGPLKDHTLNLHSDDLLPLRSGAPVYGPNEG
jgi:hypothetical protein